MKLLIYTLVSFIIISIGLILCRKFIKDEKGKYKVLKISAIATVIMHYSSLWVDFFSTKEAIVENNMLLPVYPCNIIMWLLVVCAFFKNKEIKIYNHFVEFTAIVGSFCGIVGIAINENFLSTPDFLDYDILKGLLSHTIMLFGTLYLFVMGKVKISVKNNMLSIFYGMLLFAICGGIVNLLYYAFDLGEVNAMYMLYPPFENLPFVNFYTIGIGSLLVMFIFSSTYEMVTLKKEERWYYKLRRK